jgi:lipopolysaccharide transport system permease protein
VSPARSTLEERASAPAPREGEPASAPAPRANGETNGSSRVSVITPPRRLPHLDLPELWHFRELLGTLVWRDIVVKYKQTAIGVAWAIIQPLLTMIVFTLVFGFVGGFDSKGIQYQVFSYSALLPWFYFASSVSHSSASLVANNSLVTKVYFPRVLLPLAGVTVPIIDFFIASSIMWGLLVWYDVTPSSAILLAPAFLFMAFVAALGVGLLLSALTVRYRDVPYAIPFLLQSWMFLSGVILPLSSFPEYAQWILALNPMTAVIDGFQWGVISAPAPELEKVLVSVASTLVFLIVGLWYFRRSEPKFADTI